MENIKNNRLNKVTFLNYTFVYSDILIDCFKIKIIKRD